MRAFAVEYAWVLLTLAGYALVGGFGVLPFRGGLRFPLFVAPLAGLLTMAIGVAGLYTVVGLSLTASAATVALLGSAATVIALVRLRPRIFSTEPGMWIAVAVLAAGMTYLTSYTTIHLGESGFLYMDGTDQFGYAQLSDWLRAHSVREPPLASPHLPYQSWPAYVFETDPRFGSYFTLAVIGLLRGQSGTFAYDNAGAIALMAGALGVSAVFARSKRTFLVLLAGLLTACWFDYSRSGFFGKVLGYPAAFAVAGLFFASRRRLTPLVVLSLGAVTAAAALVYPGTVTALFLLVLGGSFLALHVFHTARDGNPGEDAHPRDLAAVLALLILIGLATSGLLSRPQPSLFPPTDFSRLRMLPWLLDIQSPDYDPVFRRLGQAALAMATASAVFLSLALLAIAVRRRDGVAFALVAGPMLLIAALLLAGARASALQLIGTGYPLSLCAAAWLADGAAPAPATRGPARHLPATAFALLILVLMLRVPRFVGAVHRYASGAVDRGVQLSQSDMDGLAGAIGNHPTTVNVPDRWWGIPILVELGRRHLPLEWNPASWRAVLEYRAWDPPNPGPANSYRLEFIAATPDAGCAVKYRTPQYQLWECKVP